MSWWTDVPFPQRSLLVLWVGLPCGSYTNFYLCGLEEPSSILVLSALRDLRRQLTLPRTHAHAETAWAGRSGSLSVFNCKGRCFSAMSHWIKQNTHHHCFLTLTSKWAWSSFPSVQFSSVTQWCPTLCDPMNHRTPGLPVHHQLWSSLKLMSIESVMPSSHLILCRPLFLLLPISPSSRVLSNESTLHMRGPKYWSFSFSIIPSKEHRGLISFRMDWLDLLAVQGTLKSLLQHRSSKVSILQNSFLYSPTLTSIHDHRKNHSLD